MKTFNHPSRVLILVFLAILIFPITISFSQVHYEKFQSKIRLEHQAIYYEGEYGSPTQYISLGYEDATVNNLGSFVVGKNGYGMSLLSNAGQRIGTTFPIVSYGGEKSIAIASNHNTEVAVVNVVYHDTTTYDGLGFMHVLTQNGIGISMISSGIAQIDLTHSVILNPNLPLTAVSFFPYAFGNSLTLITHLEAKMDDKYVYITWKQSGGISPPSPLASFTNQFPTAAYFGFAIYDIQSKTFVVLPQLINDPNGNLAIGESAPTVACNRWAYNPDQCKIAFTYIDQQDVNHIVHPAVFTPLYQGAQPDAVRMADPPQVQGQKCVWVRVINFEEFEGVSGYHYFYAYYDPAINNGAVNSVLFSTDNINQFSGIIDGNLPPWKEDQYPPPGCGNGYTEKSVYFIWPHDESPRTDFTLPKPPQDLMICRDFGANPKVVYGLNSQVNQRLEPDPAHPNILPEGDNILACTLGCNQMGIQITITLDDPSNLPNGTMSFKIRASRPFAQHVRENTFLTDDCEITQNQYHNPEGESDIRVLPWRIGHYYAVLGEIPVDRNADTLRILAGAGDVLRSDPQESGLPEQFQLQTQLKYTISQNVPGIPMLVAGIPSAANTEDANHLVGPRGYIIMDGKILDDNDLDDNRAEIDFNNVAGAGFGAVSHGGFEYNGTKILHMAGTHIIVDGYHNAPDIDGVYKSVAHFNAPCTINNGSSLVSSKGLITFKDATTQADMAVFTAEGYGTSIMIDTSTLIMGGKNTSQALEQIVVNPNYQDANYSSINQNNNFWIMNSIVSSGWENLVRWGHVPDGYSSQITLNGTLYPLIYNNHFYTTFINIKNPYAGALFGYNIIIDIRKMLNIVLTPGYADWAANDIVSCSIINNRIDANFPRGSHDWSEEATDFQVTGFSFQTPDLALNPVTISDNNWDPMEITAEFPWSTRQAWTGIYLDHATFANVTGNTMESIGRCIFQDGNHISTSYFCNNQGAPSICDVDAGIGIELKSTLSVVQNNVLGRFSRGFISEEDDKSNLIHNRFEYNNVGASLQGHAETRFYGRHTSSTNVPGMNVFNNNFTTNSAQIAIVSSSTGGNPQLRLGADVDPSDELNWGQNKFMSGNGIHIRNTGDNWYDLVKPISLNEWSPAIAEDATGAQLNCSSCSVTDGEVYHIGYTNKKHVTAAINDVDCSDINYDGGTGDTKAGGKHSNTLSLIQPASGNRFPHDDPSDSVYLYWLGEWYNGVCWKCMRDTMKMYVELHPFATHYPGEVLDAIGETDFAAANTSGPRRPQAIDQFNWLIKMQPVNQERTYQYAIIDAMTGPLSEIDLNEEANMYYNWALMFPDSETVREAWQSIHDIRHYQSEIPQDTTPFHILTFPLQPLPGGTSGVNKNQPNSVTFTIAPNPAKENTVAEISTTNTGFFTIQLFDMLGKKIKDIYSGYIEAGNRKITIDMHDITQGEYFLRMGSPVGVKTVKLVHE